MSLADVTWLGSGVAVAVNVVGSCSSDSTHATDAAQKKKKDSPTRTRLMHYKVPEPGLRQTSSRTSSKCVKFSKCQLPLLCDGECHM